MTIFQNYIYNYIIKCILQYIYNKSNNLKNHYYLNKYEIPNHYNNHTIQLSLVSKKWFQSIQDILLNEILNFKNYKVLNNLIQHQPQYQNQNYNNNNNDNNYNSNNNNNKNLIKENYKLIKIKNSVIVFNSLNDYHKYTISESSTCNGLLEFKSILIKIPTHNDSIKILNNFNKFPSNCIFNLTLSVSSLKNLDLNSGVGLLKINKIKLSGFLNNINNSTSGNNKEMDTLFKNILKLNPVSITYSPNISYYEKRNIDTSVFFKDYSGRLEYIKILDNVEPMDISLLSLKSKLKSITVPLAFHQIIRALHNNKYNSQYQQYDQYEDEDEDEDNYREICTGKFNSFRNQISIESDWDSMVKVLSNHSKLKELSLFNNCGDTYYCLDQVYDSSLINNGLSVIVNNSNCNIEILTLEGYGFIDSTFINALSLNKSIRTLVLLYCHEELIFNQVLDGSNRYIRNVIVKSNILSNQILIQLKNLKNLELYSISFMNESLESLSESLEIISSSKNQFNIKEINFYLIEPNNSIQFNKPIIINNRIFINIFYKSRNELAIWDLSENSDTDIDNNTYSFGYNDD